MHVTYKSIGFVITLAKEVDFDIPVPFLFRSIIGYQLRRMCCIAHSTACANCMFNTSCIYGLTFESIVPKDNTVLAGRNRISHPVIIDCDDFTGKLKTLVLNLVFLGATIPHFPYFYYALKKGGEEGIGKERVPYHVSDIVEVLDTGERRSLLVDEQNIITDVESERWEYDAETETTVEKSFVVTLDTPLRYMAKGVEARRIVESEFAGCLHRRAQVLCSQYGHNDHTGEYGFSGSWAVTEQDIGWRRFRHYSARQVKVMWLGGMCGSFVLSGKFSSYERGLLRFTELFHGGKNTNFGLGKLKVNEHGEV